MLHEADTVGVFQVESRAQMAMLPRLRPASYYDLVIQVAIIRPGPITGGMLHPYLARRRGLEPVDYPHPDLEPVLRRTLGVPLFQEQVMRLAMEAADYTPGEADQLRRDMATWRRHGPIESHHERLVGRMTAKGIAVEFAERVFQQIKGFGEYGFPESHAASFALIAYATAWLKCHHPEVFACALLNALPMGFYSRGTIVEDARRHGIAVLPVDVTVSDADCTLEEVPAPAPPAPPPRRRPVLGVRMGLHCVKGLSAAGPEAIAAARRERLFVSLPDLARRTGLAQDELQALAAADALAAFCPERRQALWAVHGLSRRDPPGQLLLPLDDPAPAPRLRALTDLDEVNWDWKNSGHSTRAHLLEPLRPLLRERGWPTAAELNALPHGRRADYVGVVIVPPAAPHGQGRDLRHPRGRDRLREPGLLGPGLGTAQGAGADPGPDGGLGPHPVRGQRGAPGGGPGVGAAAGRCCRRRRPAGISTDPKKDATRPCLSP